MIHFLVVCWALLCFVLPKEFEVKPRVLVLIFTLKVSWRTWRISLTTDEKCTKNNWRKKFKSRVLPSVLITVLKTSILCLWLNELLIILSQMESHKKEKTTSPNPLLFYHLILLSPSKSTDFWFEQSSENCEIQWKNVHVVR